jgi:hypothetical protein
LHPGETLDRAWQVIGDDLGRHPTGKIRVEILGRPRDLARVSTLTEQEIETTDTIALSKYGKLMVVSPRATVAGYAWMVFWGAVLALVAYPFLFKSALSECIQRRNALAEGATPWL